MTDVKHTAGVFRRVLCRLSLCQTFSTNSDDTGVWGECGLCGKRVGFVPREALRRYADAEYAKASGETP